MTTPRATLVRTAIELPSARPEVDRDRIESIDRHRRSQDADEGMAWRQPVSGSMSIRAVGRVAEKRCPQPESVPE
jgi:hypothetical protein